MRHDKSASEECDDETPKPGIRGIPVAMYNPGIYARTYVRPSHMCLSGTDVLGYRVDLADRQDSLNGVWISSEKSSRRPRTRGTVVEWRAVANERDGVTRSERERRKGEKREIATLHFLRHLTLFIGIYNVMAEG